MYKTDFLKLQNELDNTVVNPHILVSKQSSPNTRKLFEYLKSIYGRGILAGQQYLQSAELEDRVYWKAAGKLPAVRGYDMMDIDKKKGDNQVERALDWARSSGCILTFCWHWYAPDDMENIENSCWSFYYKTTQYNHKTSFDIINAVDEGTPEYAFVISRIDRVAEILKRFADEDIPILWRPLHEANGNWFWWGNRGNDNGESTEAYKKLWYIIFDRLENYHKLTNLIWVWNGQHKNMAVHPNTYDICGEDIYSTVKNDHSSQKEKFLEVTSYTSNKMATLSECGYIPSPKNLKEDNVNWLWWLPWWGEFVYKSKNWHPVFDENGCPVINEKYMTEQYLREAFSDDYCITLDKLPWYSEKNDLYVKNAMSNTEKD